MLFHPESSTFSSSQGNWCRRAHELIWKAAVGGAGALAAAWLVALSTPHWLTARQESAVDVTDKALIEKGDYVAHAGDCAACHTAPGGKAFAGGLGMQTPLGTIYSTNITSDSKTGIGSYSYADFERAVRQGCAGIMSIFIPQCRSSPIRS
ncbi:hypothetical protein [Brucella intermedia]|uniref:hypothetical protein n=1 Tax=Brucella intermedia TaxID=94625 RepID=UPI001FFF0AE6|nr:hypothetical protein [Brucella intermedia]